MTKPVVAGIAFCASLLVVALSFACGSGGTTSPEAQDGTPEPTVARPSPVSCQYELTEDPDSVEIDQFPPGLYPADVQELGSGMSVTLVDPHAPSRELTLTVPQCKKDEALRIIEARQQADREQAEAGIPFEERTYEEPAE